MEIPEIILTKFVKRDNEGGFFLLNTSDQIILCFGDFDQDLMEQQIIGKIIWDILPDDWIDLLKTSKHNLQKPGQQDTLFFSKQEFKYQVQLRSLLDGQFSVNISIVPENLENQFLLIQHQLAQKLSVNHEVESVLFICLEQLFKISEMNCGGVYLINKKTGDLELKIHQGLSQQFVNEVRLVKKGSDRWSLVNKGMPLYLEYEKLPFYFTKGQLSEGLKSFVLLPIRYLGELIGCINLASKQAKNIPEKHRKIFETLAIQMGPAIERLLEQKKYWLDSIKYENIFNDIQVGLIICDLDQRILQVNHYLKTTFGYQASDLLNHSLSVLFPPEVLRDLSGIFSDEDQFLKDPKIISLATGDGREIKTNIFCTLIMWGADPAYLIFCKEILEAKTINVPFIINYSAYDRLPTPVFVVEQETFSLVYANLIARSQYQIAESELTQTTFLQFFDLDGSIKFSKYIHENRFSEVTQKIWIQTGLNGEKIKTRIFIQAIKDHEKVSYFIVVTPFYSFADEKTTNIQNRYQAVLDQQTDLILRFSPDGLITYANQAYCDFFGISLNNLLGTSFIKNVYPNDLDIVTNHLQLLTPLNPIRESKNRMLDGQNRVHWINWIDQAIYEGENLVEIQSVGRKINDEINPDNWEIQFRELFENIPAIFYILEAKTLYPIFINKQLEGLTGFTKEEIYIPGFWEKHIHPGDFEQWVNIMRKRRNEGIARIVKFRFLTKTGKYISLMDQGTLITLPGQGKFLIGTVIDHSVKKD